jgi:hypothetical protein
MFNWLAKLFKTARPPAYDVCLLLADIPWHFDNANCAQKCAAYARHIVPTFGADVRLMHISTRPGYGQEYQHPTFGTIRQHMVVCIEIDGEDWFLDVRDPLYFKRRPPPWFKNVIQVIPRAEWMDKTNRTYADPKGYVAPRSA